MFLSITNVEYLVFFLPNSHLTCHVPTESDLPAGLFLNQRHEVCKIGFCIYFIFQNNRDYCGDHVSHLYMLCIEYNYLFC